MTNDSLGLYVHLPWCTQKCPYCDFNSYTAGDTLAEDRYVDVLLRDLANECQLSPAPRLASIFIGGGTPSLFSARAITRLLAGVAALTRFADDIEITLEANPGSAEAGRFKAYRQAGVNRLSLGIQSFNDRQLQALGRVHSAAEATAAIAASKAAGFDNLNLDLMFGLPGTGSSDALDDLRRAIDFAPQHVSWYQLTLEAGTAFARRPPQLPSHDAVCDEYDAGLTLLADAGYVQYEISAHAQTERQSRHNLNYWRFGDYLGIGAGAHGKRGQRDGIVRRHKIRHPERYMKVVESGADAASDVLTAPAELVTEYMLNALRLREGFTAAAFSSATGLAADDAAFVGPLTTALERGWMEQNGQLLRPSDTGFRFLNDLQLLFLSDAGAD